MPAERIETIVPSEDIAIQRGAERGAIEAADVLRVAYQTRVDQRIDHRDARLIRDEIEVAERALASLCHHLDMQLTPGAFSRRE